ncbi:MAG TPA: mechanosensitive ion channel domain-containing protein [Candidatus Sulfomarinibacteraceae bacterium]|nr:mechanosensitive ion channel domain-containing protein [Candidatus Sulfomarinibacteraceae bacterium]
MSLPIGDHRQGQLLSLFGIVLSAAVALSATNFLGNALAGFMLRSIRHFRIGDFNRCGEHFGRVTERSLLHTEIQTEDRDLTTLPNLFLISNPMTTVRSSGTIVSATVSLGYDIPRKRIETLKAERKSASDDAARENLDRHLERMGRRERALEEHIASRETGDGPSD